MRPSEGKLDTYLKLDVTVEDQEVCALSYKLNPIQQIYPKRGKIIGYTTDLTLGSRTSGTAIRLKLDSLADLVKVRDFLCELGDSWAEKLEALEDPTDG